MMLAKRLSSRGPAAAANDARSRPCVRALAARLCWRHGGAIKVGEFDDQNKGAPTRGVRLRKAWLCASPVADGTTAGADLRSTVIHFASHVVATDCRCDRAARV